MLKPCNQHINRSFPRRRSWGFLTRSCHAWRTPKNVCVGGYISHGYSGSSLNRHSRKRTALCTAASLKPHRNHVFLHSPKRTISLDGRGGHFQSLLQLDFSLVFKLTLADTWNEISFASESFIPLNFSYRCSSQWIYISFLFFHIHVRLQFKTPLEFYSGCGHLFRFPRVYA